MKHVLAEIQESIKQSKNQKVQFQQYLQRFSGRHVTLGMLFLKEDMYTDSMHDVKLKKALHLVDEIIDKKVYCIGSFSKA